MVGVNVTVYALPDNDGDTFGEETSEHTAIKRYPPPDGNPSVQAHNSTILQVLALDLDGQGRTATKNVDSKPKRPMLQREKSVPLSQQPSLSALPQISPDANNPADSLSIAQLKKLVADIPREEQAPYAFTYEDTGSFQEEVEELFSYTVEEQSHLLQARSIFLQRWTEFGVSDEEGGESDTIRWTVADEALKKKFLTAVKSDLASDQAHHALMVLVYLALGCWYDTALQETKPVRKRRSSKHDTYRAAEARRFSTSETQVSTMKKNIHLIAEEVGVQAIFDAFRRACLDEFDEMDYELASRISNDRNGISRWASLVLLCLLADSAKRDPERSNVSEQIMTLDPELLMFLTQLLSDLRWSDTNAIPPAKIISLYWKIILLKFGGTPELVQCKKGFSKGDEQRPEKDNGQYHITASPLDYHVFRQEITSKYPAFKPPPPLFPFQPGYDSMLPPVDDRLHRGQSEEERLLRGPASFGDRGSSIISQPVHIATPAPSPPPSPAGPGGKGVKKQNYQTNQMFPMLYPPMDESSNNIGGKGTSEIQDLMVGRKWKGCDIPCSILEAADIFSKRMRAGRGMKQLWEERVRFLKYERGVAEQFPRKSKAAAEQRRMEEQEDIKDLVDLDLRKRLEAVEVFYKQALPHLQSVVLVLLRVLLQTVTTLVTQSESAIPIGSPNAQTSQDPHDQNGSTTANAHEDITGDREKPGIPSLEDVDQIRSQEIMGKGVSAILLLLLKWFKLSHILKFEHLSQLLLDANYLQIILKLFTHQDVEHVIRHRTERKNFNFFKFCQANSRYGLNKAANNDSDDESSSSEDEGPASKPQETLATTTTNNANNSDTEPSTPPPPKKPLLPITSYSYRTLFSTLNHLTITQKIIARKAHRQLLMVQYKSSATLKKCLKVAEPSLRLATLKCIKGQVPYCHRKWRQGNMRIITAIYMHCKPTLRDEWLAGIDVDQELNEALPQEQALRALTAWFHARRYPVRARGEVEGEEEDDDDDDGEEDERDFFADELDKMDMARREGEGEGEVEDEGFQTDEDWDPALNVPFEEWLSRRRL